MRDSFQTRLDWVDDNSDDYPAVNLYAMALFALVALVWHPPPERLQVFACTLFGTVHLVFGITGHYPWVSDEGRAQQRRRTADGDFSNPTKISRWKINFGMTLLAIAAALSAFG
jgi:hypothetical protein